MAYAHVTDEGLKLLEKELKSTKDHKRYRRLKIIQLSSQGAKIPQLVKQFDVCENTIRNYIKRYDKGGLETLKRSNSDGRSSRIQLTKAEWEELLRCSPCQFVKLNTGSRNWTQKMLSQYCGEYLGIQISRSGISKLLKRIGIRWNYGKFVRKYTAR